MLHVREFLYIILACSHAMAFCMVRDVISGGFHRYPVAKSVGSLQAVLGQVEPSADYLESKKYGALIVEYMHLARLGDGADNTSYHLPCPFFLAAVDGSFTMPALTKASLAAALMSANLLGPSFWPPYQRVTTTM